jgi:hypothetical protein
MVIAMTRRWRLTHKKQPIGEYEGYHKLANCGQAPLTNPLKNLLFTGKLVDLL